MGNNSMTFNEYQGKALESALRLAKTTAWYPALGLAGEAGEVVEVVKKFYRDSAGDYVTTRYRICQELGDVLWYCSALADFWGIQLDEVASSNIVKLQSRKERGTLQGSGDER